MRYGVRVTSLVLASVLTLVTEAGGIVAPASGVGAAGRAAPCAWGFTLNEKNVIWPETNAVFWQTPYILFPGSEIVVTGTYPEARYMSVKTYTIKTILDSLNDQQIQPDQGSENPFNTRDVPEDPDMRRYTVHVRPGAAVADGDNVLAAFENGGSFGFGVLSYRVYVPDDPSNVAGGTLPDVTIRMFNGRIEKKLPTCPQSLSRSGAVPTFGPEQQSVDAADGDDVTPIVFEVNSAAHFFPNPDDAYLVGTAEPAPGRVAVVRAKAAEFPNTREGAHVTDPHDMRYWSMCVHMIKWPLPTSACAGDFETVLDADGWYTYVVSMPQDRPVNADAEHGVTWLPWGEADVDVALTLRNMLPAETFDHAIQDVAESGAAPEVMGDYYPQGGLCDRTLFEAQGFTACIPPG